jgi:hypothetical protein
MAYGEDEELNWRVRQRGFEVILCPALLQHYRPRASLGGLWRQYWNYGRGRMRVLRKHPDFLAPRHLAPSALVVVLAGLAAAGAVVPAARAALSLVAVAWGAILAGAACSARGARWRERLLRRAPWPACTACMARDCAGAGAALGRRALPGRPARPASPSLGPPPASRSPSSSAPRIVPRCWQPVSSRSGTRLAAQRKSWSWMPARRHPDVVDRLAENMRGCRVALSSVPGLPRQRNLGARATTGSVVVTWTTTSS